MIGKYKKKKLIQVNFYIDPIDKSSLEKLAEDNDVNFSELVRIILKDFIEKNNGGDLSNGS
jgi:hypothetical protein